MKSILAVAFIAGFVAAEVPSHSYLPPPPRGYSSGPAVVTARALQPQPGNHNGEHTTIGFARSSTPTPQARFGDDQSYDQNTGGYTKNGLDDANSTVSYEADGQGYKPQVSYEDSDDLARSSPGYDANSNNFRGSNAYGVEQDGGHNGYHGNDQNGGRPNARSNGYN